MQHYLILLRKYSRASGPAIFLLFFTPVAILAAWILVRPGFGELSIPSTLNIMLGCITGYTIARIPMRPLLICYSAYFLFSALLAVPAYKKWSNILNYGTHTPLVNEPVPDFELHLLNGSRISNRTIRGKILLLDFWNTRCGVCYRKFPDLERLHKKKSMDTIVDIYTVNIPLGKNEDSAKRILPYSFHQLLAKDYASATIFNVKSYPTTIVIYDERILLRGSLEDASNLIEELTKQHRY